MRACSPRPGMHSEVRHPLLPHGWIPTTATVQRWQPERVRHVLVRRVFYSHPCCAVQKRCHQVARPGRAAETPTPDRSLTNHTHNTLTPLARTAVLHVSLSPQATMHAPLLMWPTLCSDPAASGVSTSTTLVSDHFLCGLPQRTVRGRNTDRILAEARNGWKWTCTHPPRRRARFPEQTHSRWLDAEPSAATPCTARLGAYTLARTCRAMCGAACPQPQELLNEQANECWM